MKITLKNLGKSVLRIVGALALMVVLASFGYILWQPGEEAPLPQFKANAIWLGHGWLGDDAWFVRNRRDRADFRSEKKIAALFAELSRRKISLVYPHLCPAQYHGEIAPYSDEQLELFLDFAAPNEIKVIPWVGGVRGESVRLASAKWRCGFIASVEKLLRDHPRLAGVQVNIEPLPSGDARFLQLLTELRSALGPGKILSVAAYPPPTGWHRFPEVHWELEYLQKVARYADQIVVMMYDTAIPLEKFYVKLMIGWTKELSEALCRSKVQLIAGVPAYEDAGVGYHHPRVENLSSALRGIAASGAADKLAGIAIYCEWEMDDAKWRIWDQFIR